MNSSLSNMLKYVLANYPHKSELSASRLTKIMYLADWKAAIDLGRTLTGVVWRFNHYGPYVDDFVSVAKADKDISVEFTQTVYGGRKQLFSLVSNVQKFDIDSSSKSILDFVMDATKSKNYDDFIKLVYSTYPVVSSSRYSELNLVSLAKQYKQIAVA